MKLNSFLNGVSLKYFALVSSSEERRARQISGIDQVQQEVDAGRRRGGTERQAESVEAQDAQRSGGEEPENPCSSSNNVRMFDRIDVIGCVDTCCA